MIAILAICADRHDEWIALGHTRELAEESYTASASFYPKPLYRLVITPKQKRLWATSSSSSRGPSA